MQDEGAQVLLMVSIAFSVLTVLASVLAIGIIKRRNRKGRKVTMAKPGPGYHTDHRTTYSQVLDTYDRNTR